MIKVSACSVENPGSIPGSGRNPPEKEMAIHSSISCLGNPMDRGAWQSLGLQSDTTEQLTPF